MSHIFEVIDKLGKEVHLSDERWSHIRKKHPEVQEWEWIKETLKNPDKSVEDEYNESTIYFYKFYKNTKAQNRYLCVIINYLNRKGYVLTAYFTKHIKN